MKKVLSNCSAYLIVNEDKWVLAKHTPGGKRWDSKSFGASIKDKLKLYFTEQGLKCAFKKEKIKKRYR